jgi:choice-of-anchor C domain-containing protein
MAGLPEKRVPGQSVFLTLTKRKKEKKTTAMKKLKFIALIGMLAVALGAVTAQATPFSNGSFETPASPFTQPFTTLLSGSTAIDSWTVGGNSIDWIGTYWTPQDGDRSLDMSGNNAGSIAQTFDTILNQQYEVKFWMAGNPAGDPDIKTQNVAAAAANANFTFDLNGYDLVNMGWVEKSFLFTATGTSTTLTFTSLDNTAYGPALDNVSVNAIPIPPSALLMGSGLLGLVGLGWRRRQDN